MTRTSRLEITAQLAYRVGDDKQIRAVGEEQTRSVTPKRMDDVKAGPYVAECDETMVGRERYIVFGKVKYIRDGAEDISRDFNTDLDDAVTLSCPGSLERTRRQARGCKFLARYPANREGGRAAPSRQLRRSLGDQPYAPPRTKRAWEAHHILPARRRSAILQQAMGFRCGIHPNNTDNGIYLRGFGLKRTIRGQPNAKYRLLKEREPALAERTYHGDTFGDDYIRELYRRFVDLGGYEPTCSLLRRPRIAGALSGLKGDLRDGKSGIEKEGS